VSECGTPAVLKLKKATAPKEGRPNDERRTTNVERRT
jgi:hypothetical protein